jgi:hypothetical protein
MRTVWLTVWVSEREKESGRWWAGTLLCVGDGRGERLAGAARVKAEEARMAAVAASEDGRKARKRASGFHFPTGLERVSFVNDRLFEMRGILESRREREKCRWGE